MVLEGIALAATLLSVAVSIFKCYDEAAKNKATAAFFKAGDIANYFLNISQTIAKAADDIERGSNPYGCDFLARSSKDLPAILWKSGLVSDKPSGLMKKREADEYARQLQEASDLEHSVNKVSQEERQEMVDVLRTASGTFQAIGYGIFARR